MYCITSHRLAYLIALAQPHQAVLCASLFMGGIGIYYNFPNEPSILWALPIFLISLLLHRFAFMRLCCLCCLGILWAHSHFYMHKPLFTANHKKEAYIRGHIDHIESYSRGYRLIIATQQQRFLLSTHGYYGDLKPGDIIGFYAELTPILGPRYPDGFDPKRYYSLRGIGAKAYSSTDLTLLASSSTSHLSIDQLRQKTEQKLLAALPLSQAAIANALLIGKRNHLSHMQKTQITQIGLAHLLAISGLHLAMVAASVFFLTRALLACISVIALRYNVAFIAALAALCSSFAYLLITGAPVSAQRAWIMVACVLIGVCIDRKIDLLRCLAFAAFIILTCDPPALLTAGFQLSFAATAALLCGGGYMSEKLKEAHLFLKLLRYPITILYTSFLASLATTAFVIFHFGEVSKIGLVSNLIAIPLVSFWVMPWGLLALLAMPLDLHLFPLEMMGSGIDLLNQLTQRLSNGPSPIWQFTPMRFTTLLLFCISGLCWLLWKRPLSYLSLVFACLAILHFHATPLPDILIDRSGTLFALKNSQGKLTLSSRTHAYASRKLWLKYFKQKDYYTIAEASDPLFECNKSWCIYRKFGKKIAIVFQETALQCFDCDQTIYAKKNRYTQAITVNKK